MHKNAQNPALAKYSVYLYCNTVLTSHSLRLVEFQKGKICICIESGKNVGALIYARLHAVLPLRLQLLI